MCCLSCRIILALWTMILFSISAKAYYPQDNDSDYTPPVKQQYKGDDEPMHKVYPEDNDTEYKAPKNKIPTDDNMNFYPLYYQN